MECTSCMSWKLFCPGDLPGRKVVLSSHVMEPPFSSTASLVAISASSTIGVAAFCIRTLLTAGHPVLVRILVKGLSK
eukprot:678800-Heterocapsa_arctica.AAC.1